MDWKKEIKIRGCVVLTHPHLFVAMHIGELRPQIGDFAMRMAFLVSKKVLFLAWQGAAKPMLRCNVDADEV